MPVVLKWRCFVPDFQTPKCCTMLHKIFQIPPKEQPPLPAKPELVPPVDPEEPQPVPEEDPDIIPDEDPFETPPYEVPVPGEGP